MRCDSEEETNVISVTDVDYICKDGFRVVSKRQRKSTNSSLSSYSVASKTVRTNSSDTSNQSKYVLIMKLNSPPNLIQLSKGIRSLNLQGNLQLAKIAENKFKLTVDNQHAMNKLLLTPAIIPPDWKSFGIFDMNIDTPYSRPANTTRSHTFVIKGVDLTLSDDEIKNEINLNGSVVTGVKRIISAVTGNHTYLVRVFTKSKIFMNRCLADGIQLVFMHHICEASNGYSISIQCGKCLKLGHTRAKCHEPLACFKCGGDHTSTNCTTTGVKQCILCKGDHLATSAICPAKVAYRKNVSSDVVQQPALPVNSKWSQGPPKNLTSPPSNKGETCQHGCLSVQLKDIINLMCNVMTQFFVLIKGDNTVNLDDLRKALQVDLFNHTLVKLL